MPSAELIRSPPARSPFWAFAFGEIPFAPASALKSAATRGPLLTPAPDVATGLGPQISLSKVVNSCCTTGPFISGAEHRAALCRASSPAPSTLYGLGLALSPLAWPCGPLAAPNSFRACPRRSSLFVGSSALTRSFLPTDLAAPQLLRSSACVMLRFVMNASLTAFPHRGLPPHRSRPCQAHTSGLERTRDGASRWHSDVSGPAPLRPSQA